MSATALGLVGCPGCTGPVQPAASAKDARERQHPDRSTAPRSLLEYGNISTPERTQGRRKACWQQRRQPQQQDTARLAQTRPNRMARNTTKRPRRAPAQQPPEHRQSVKTAIGRERLKLGEPHGQEESQVPYWLLALFAGAAHGNVGARPWQNAVQLHGQEQQQPPLA